ncbi:MAG: beta-N-acetylhexosaminidase [Burkholderiales bacterium]|nr:beta-N-acetylhexosaminidase [Burkholderiales bacterium]
MKLKLLCLVLGLVTTSFMSSADNIKKSDIEIEKIKIGKFSGDTKPSEFSVLINFKNEGNDIDDWRFGFYMPRSFDTLLTQNINPDLKMQICNVDGSCSNLRYVSTDSVKNKDVSQGYFTVLEPIEKFTIQKNSSYIIKLLHNNQSNISNNSSVPQSLFIMNKDNSDTPVIYPLLTDATKYALIGIDQDLIESKAQDRINENWANSQPAKDNIVNIVPSPVSIRQGALGDYTFNKTIAVHNQLDENNNVVNDFVAILKKDLNISASIDNEGNAETGIVITNFINPIAINNNPEGYRLSVTSDGVVIEALTQTGVYYAFQTLRQIYIQGNGHLPAVTITDYPQFKYRGVLLDVARHYFTPDEIKKLIDIMAASKLNTLHLHLSDDEAFRIDIPQYPSLTSIGAVRGLGQTIGANMLIQNNLDMTNLSQINYPLANTPYGGGYTANDISNIIKYANDNQITVIPEIDIPGHARALIKSLPESMVDYNDNSQYLSVQGYKDNVLPVCTYDTDISIGQQFTKTIDDIINSTAKLFSNQTTVYNINNEISIAGDEVSSAAWTNSSSCRNEWSSLSALDKSQLFIQKFSNNNSDLTLSGWQQSVQDDNGVIGQNVLQSHQSGHIWVWNPSNHGGINQAVTLANANYPVVLAFADKTYFDLAYSPSIAEPGFTWAGKYMDTYNTLDVAHSSSQVLKTTTNPQNILGIEGALWSENLASFDHLMYMAMPKLPALAEASWSSGSNTFNNQELNWQDFATRMGCGESGFVGHLAKIYNINYRGYPNGISNEVPHGTLCPIKSDVVPTEK